MIKVSRKVSRWEIILAAILKSKVNGGRYGVMVKRFDGGFTIGVYRHTHGFGVMIGRTNVRFWNMKKLKSGGGYRATAQEHPLGEIGILINSIDGVTVKRSKWIMALGGQKMQNGELRIDLGQLFIQYFPWLREG